MAWRRFRSSRRNNHVASYIHGGNGRSWRAEEAEDEGKRPLTRAIPIVATRLGVTRHTARAILKHVGPCEWHHTGLRARRTNYYDPDMCVRAVALAPAAYPQC